MRSILLALIASTAFRAPAGAPVGAPAGAQGSESAVSRVPGWRAAIERVNERLRTHPISWLDGHQGVTSRMRMSPDGARAVTWAEDGSAWLWNAWTGESIGLLGMFGMGETSSRPPGGQSLQWPRLEFSADGERILLIEPVAGLAGLWDGRSAEFLGYLEVGEELARTACFSPDGQRVAVANGSGIVRLHDTASGLALEVPALEAQDVDELSFSPDGAWILALGARGRARVFDARTGALRGELGSAELPLVRATFSADGTHVLGASPGGIAVVCTLHSADGKTPPLEPALVRAPEGAWLSVDWSTGRRIDSVGDRRTRGLSVLPRGDRLLVFTPERTALLWDPGTNRIVAPLAGIEFRAGARLWASFSRDGERLLTIIGNRGRLFDAATGELVAELPFLADYAAFSPSGRYFATAHSAFRGRTGVYDVRTGSLVDTLELGNGSVFALHFSDNDRLGGTTAFGWASVWDGDDAPVVLGSHTLQLVEEGLELGFARWSADGAHVVTPTWGRHAWYGYRLWDARTGSLVRELPSGAFSGGGFLADGGLLTMPSSSRRMITAVALDGPAGRAGIRMGDRIVKLGERTVQTAEDLEAAVAAATPRTTVVVARGGEELEFELELPPDPESDARAAQRLVLTEDFAPRVEIQDPVTGELRLSVELDHVPGPVVQQALVNRDATRLLLRYSTTADFFDLASGRCIERFAVVGLRRQSTHQSRMHIAAMSPRGDVLAGAQSTGVAVWTEAGGLVPEELPGTVVDLAFSPDGWRLAGASPDGSVIVWDLAENKVQSRLEGHAGEVRFVAFDADGSRIVSAGADGTARIWDLSGAREPIVLAGHAGLVGRASFSADGSRVLTPADDGTAGLWDAASGARIALLEGHVGPVILGEFSPDGSRILTQSMDGSTRVWSGADGRLLATRVEYDDGWLVFEPGGHFIAGGAGAEHAKMVVNGRRYPLSSYAAIYESPEKVKESLAGKKVRAPAFAPQAPEVRVASPLDPRIPERTFRFEALIEDVYGIESVSVVQDERELDPKWIGEHLVVDGKSARLSCDLALAEGANQTTVRIRARNARKIQSAPRTVVARWQPPQRELYVLAMGVADYRDDTLDLAYPVKDVDDLIARFQAEEGGYYKKVNTQRLVDAEVTPGRLRKAREEFLLRAQPEDTIVVFAAGHGVRSESGEYYFLPAGTTPKDPYDGIERQALESLVTWDRLHAKRRILLLDTCHSGEAFGEGKRGVAADAFDQKTLDEAAGTGLYILAASSEAGFAQETRGNGLFTRCLIEGLDGAADTNGDGHVGIEELRIYATAAVHDRSAGRQRPTAPRIVGGDDFPLVRRR